MCGQFYLDTMQIWSCDIFRSDGPIRKPETPLQQLESQDHFYDMMHVIQRQIDACNARASWCV